MEIMRKIAGVALLVCAAALVCAAQTTTRTATYNYKGNQTGAGAVAGTPGTYTVTFSGQAQSTNNKIAVNIDVFTFTLVYTASNGTGTVVGGTWSATTINKDRSALTVGGTVEPGAALALKPDGTVAPGNFALVFDAGDPTWPVTGNLVGSIDKSQPPRTQGLLTLTYPVVQ